MKAHNPPTWIEIDTDSFDRNIERIRTFAGQSDLAIIITSNAYGHGMLLCAQLCELNTNVTSLCVHSTNEAVTLRTHGIKKPIIVLSLLDFALEQALLLNNIVLVAYNDDSFNRISKAAATLHVTASIHIKINTGSSLLGIDPENAVSWILSRHQQQHINIDGIFTDISSTKSNARQQLELFNNTIVAIKKEIPGLKTHMLSCRTFWHVHDYPYTYVRVGAEVYGLSSSYYAEALEPIIRWKTSLIQTKEIPTGTPIGYSGTVTTRRPTVIGVLPIGYGDGYPRALSNRGYVYIHGQGAPVLGIISMNLTIIDITDIPHATIGDEVTLVGAQADITPDSIARLYGGNDIELTTRINTEIPRIARSNNH